MQSRWSCKGVHHDGTFPFCSLDARTARVHSLQTFYPSGNGRQTKAKSFGWIVLLTSSFLIQHFPLQDIKPDNFLMGPAGREHMVWTETCRWRLSCLVLPLSPLILPLLSFPSSLSHRCTSSTSASPNGSEIPRRPNTFLSAKTNISLVCQKILEPAFSVASRGPRSLLTLKFPHNRHRHCALRQHQCASGVRAVSTRRYRGPGPCAHLFPSRVSVAAQAFCASFHWDVPPS